MTLCEIYQMCSCHSQTIASILCSLFQSVYISFLFRDTLNHIRSQTLENNQKWPDLRLVQTHLEQTPTLLFNKTFMSHAELFRCHRASLWRGHRVGCIRAVIIIRLTFRDPSFGATTTRATEQTTPFISMLATKWVFVSQIITLRR